MSSESHDVTYERPDERAQARALLAEHGRSAKLTAGNQSLSLLLRQNLLDPEVIVDISGVDELGGISVADGTVEVGAVTTYDELDDHAVSTDYPILGDAVSVIADPQVRNLGTIGGAVSHADPSLDIVPPLVCLGAEIVVGSTDGSRTVSLEDFAEGYMTTDLAKDELVEAVRFEAHGDATGSAYEKHSNVKGGWATVGAGAVVTVDDGQVDDLRVALAAVGDTTVRATSVESALVGEPATSEAVADAAEAVVDDIDPLDDISGSASYKASLAQTLTKRAVASGIERAGGEL
jgi:carbon-monoxide dehydrogenase medium subunit